LDDRHLAPGEHGKARWNNYFQNSFGLVLVQEVMAYLTGKAETRSYDYICGQTVTIPLPAGRPLAPYVLRAGSAQTPIPQEGGQATLDIRQAGMPGNFQVVGSDGKPVAAFSMNIDPEESRLEQVPASEIQALFGDKAVLSISQRINLRDALQSHWSQPVDLVPWLLMLLLLAFASENLLANNFYGHEPSGQVAA
jgi:hypothetical protein